MNWDPMTMHGFRNCADCGGRVRCCNRDELALCESCLEDRADAQAAQFLAEEPATPALDDIEIPSFNTAETVERIMASLNPEEWKVFHAQREADKS